MEARVRSSPTLSTARSTDVWLDRSELLGERRSWKSVPPVRSETKAGQSAPPASLFFRLLRLGFEALSGRSGAWYTTSLEAM